MSIVLENIEGITFNGINLANELSDNNDIQRDYFIVNSVYGRGVIGLDDELIYVPGMDGAYPSAPRINPRYLDVKITIKGNSFGHLRKKIERLNEILSVRHEVEITFDDEKDRIYYGKIYAVDGDYESSCVYQTLITFLCSDPYKYGPEKTLPLAADIATLINDGTVDAEPVFELTAKKKATFAMISNGSDDDSDYNLLGIPADVDEQIVDSRVPVLDERGDTLDSWTETGTSVDGDVSGAMAPDGTGIVVTSYGTGERWHGPALLKEIDPIQDFEVEMRLRADTSNPSQTYRIEFYLFDEFMNELGKMAVVDNSVSMIQYAAEGRYGPFVGTHVNYSISSKNYLWRLNHFHGMVRMRRVGQRFEFYVARMGQSSAGEHFDTLTQEYIDVGNQYQGRLKYVQIHIGKFSGTSAASVPRINAIKVTELNEFTVDQTPYIVYPGDTVTFDHKDDILLINGEPRNDLKDFGGSFFTLKKGLNDIIVSPADTFDAVVKYRNKYL